MTWRWNAAPTGRKPCTLVKYWLRVEWWEITSPNFLYVNRFQNISFLCLLFSSSILRFFICFRISFLYPFLSFRLLYHFPVVISFRISFFFLLFSSFALKYFNFDRFPDILQIFSMYITTDIWHYIYFVQCFPFLLVPILKIFNMPSLSIRYCFLDFKNFWAPCISFRIFSNNFVNNETRIFLVVFWPPFHTHLHHLWFKSPSNKILKGTISNTVPLSLVALCLLCCMCVPPHPLPLSLLCFSNEIMAGGGHNTSILDWLMDKSFSSCWGGTLAQIPPEYPSTGGTEGEEGK